VFLEISTMRVWENSVPYAIELTRHLEAKVHAIFDLSDIGHISQCARLTPIQRHEASSVGWK